MTWTATRDMGSWEFFKKYDNGTSHSDTKVYVNNKEGAHRQIYIHTRTDVLHT